MIYVGKGGDEWIEENDEITEHNVNNPLVLAQGYTEWKNQLKEGSINPFIQSYSNFAGFFPQKDSNLKQRGNISAMLQALESELKKIYE